MNTRPLLAGMAVLAGLGTCAFAAGNTFTILDGKSDWTVASSYKDALSAPGADDIVIIPAAATVYLNCSTDAASLNLVKSLRNIYLTDANSRFEIKVDGTDEVEIPVSISAYQFSGKTVPGLVDYTGGPVVKTGTGTLHLSSCGFHGNASNSYDYYTSLVAAEGTLKVLNGYGAGGRKNCSLGRVTVNEGATFFPPYSTNQSDGGVTKIMSFSGAGTVTSAVATVIYFTGMRSRGDDGVFSGSFGGPIKFSFAYTTDLDAQAITGYSLIDYSESDVWNLSHNGRLGYGNLAMAANTPSAFGYYKNGSNLWLSERGFTLEYVGDQEFTTVQGFVFKAPGTAPVVFDGGWHGGVTFQGQWQRLYSSAGGQGVVLAGSNTVACVLDNNISDNTTSTHANGRGHTLYISKEGTGTWLIKETPTRNVFASGFSVNEGVLQYDSMAEAGEVCALGMGTNLTDGVLGVVDTNAEHRVGYAVRFGAPTLAGESKTSGRLEYVNEKWHASTTTRAFALAGEGGFTANGVTSAVVYASGVYSVTTNPAALHLDGSSTLENVVENVSDGTNTVSIVKDGSGTWVLGGDLTFTGDITVKGGTLLIRKPSYYSWYRWTVTGLYGTTDNFLQYYELGYFAADGANQVLDYTECTNAQRVTHAGVKSKTDFMLLKPGTAQHHFNGNFACPNGSNDSAGIPLSLDRGFDGLYNGIGVWGVKYQMAHPDTGNYCHPVQDDPKTWIPLTVRMKEDAKEIVGFDFANVGGMWSATGCKTCISNCIVEASLDGLHWDTLTNLVGAAIHYDGGMWSCQGGYSDGEETHKTRFTDSFPNRNAHYKSYPLAGRPARLPTVLDPAGFVSVSGGGCLKADRSGGATAITISKLRVNGTGSAGTIDGFALAEEGVIDVPDVREMTKDLALPIVFENTEGLANLANWTLTAGGKSAGGRQIAVRDGRLYVQPSGLILIVR